MSQSWWAFAKFGGMTIGTVIFDLAGVVCRFDRERRVTALAAVHFGPAGGLDAVQRLTRDLHAHGLLSRPMPGATP